MLHSHGLGVSPGSIHHEVITRLDINMTAIEPLFRTSHVPDGLSVYCIYYSRAILEIIKWHVLIIRKIILAHGRQHHGAVSGEVWSSAGEESDRLPLRSSHTLPPRTTTSAFQYTRLINRSQLLVFKLLLLSDTEKRNRSPDQR